MLLLKFIAGAYGMLLLGRTLGDAAWARHIMRLNTLMPFLHNSQEQHTTYKPGVVSGGRGAPAAHTPAAAPSAPT